MESESGKGSGFNKTAFTTLKIAVFAPIPSVRTASAARVKPGFLRSTRMAWTSDWWKSLINDHPDGLARARRPPSYKLLMDQDPVFGAGGRSVRVWDACVRNGNGSCSDDTPASRESGWFPVAAINLNGSNYYR